MKREIVDEVVAQGAYFVLMKSISTKRLKNVWRYVYRNQIEANQKSKYEANNLVEVMEIDASGNTNGISTCPGTGLFDQVPRLGVGESSGYPRLEKGEEASSILPKLLTLDSPSEIRKEEEGTGISQKGIGDCDGDGG
ncbi:hypothetical protein HAX54_003635 [Datura stramonium]|uniref:Uncharacterized protein n=1 Tax=Datura stramonium TaxID=4076 RepID=A0ABS8T6D2_DATST|nr:hypothetical protein [Datura stramonium]